MGVQCTPWKDGGLHLLYPEIQGMQRECRGPFLLVKFLKVKSSVDDLFLLAKDLKEKNLSSEKSASPDQNSFRRS